MTERSDEELIPGSSVYRSASFRRVALLVTGACGVMAIAGGAFAWHRQHSSGAAGMPAVAVMEETQLFSIHVPASIRKDCDKTYSHCLATSPSGIVNCPSTCCSGLKNLLRLKITIPTAHDAQLAFDRLHMDGGCTFDVTQKCTTDFGGYIGAQVSGTQVAIVGKEAEVCPHDRPKCVGFVAGVGGVGGTLGTCTKASATVPWPTGETATCQNQPGWHNNYAKCFEEETDPNLCTAQGWTCAGYIMNKFCRNGAPAVFEHGTPSGPNMNYPEQNCCACGKGTSTR
eukprot:CAMPEP_0117520586 /NCGR_PEP_ID=MMETSP0784-20121206/33242_1 /TAXON_ID=39447 /ORGANISM="" /LENGTH=284 /DNA_ID=CAMNT_0005316579 /DNA_START=16 /DNA_END=870 /DNA_ORIENTATION=-